MKRQTWHLVSYEPSRGEPRTVPEVVCGDCFYALHDATPFRKDGPWAIHHEDVVDAIPERCPWCQAVRVA